MVASAVMGFALVVMISLHSQAVRSNMHAKRMTDCTYLAQAQMELLHALPWTTADSPPSQLVDTGVDTTAPWAYFEHPTSGHSHLLDHRGIMQPQIMPLVPYHIT